MKLFLLVSATLFALAACGDDSSSRNTHDAAVTHDGGSADGAVSDAAVSGVVKIQVSSGGAGVGNAQTYFLNADNSVVGAPVTDGTGTASETMVAGGSVTVAVTQSVALARLLPIAPTGFTRLYTFEGVKPGDVLHVDLDVNTGDDGQAVNITAPANGTAPSAYTIASSCDLDGPSSLATSGSGTSILTGQIQVTTGCTVADLVISEQLDDAYVFATAPATTLASSVDLTGHLGAYTAATTETFTYTDVTPSPGLADVHQYYLTTHGQTDTQLDLYGDADTATHTFTSSGPIASLTGARLLTVSRLEQGSADFGSQEVVELAAAGSSYSLDVGATVLHTYTSAPSYDLATHAVTWTTTTGGQDSAFDVVEVERDINSGSGGSVDWSVASPHAAGSITFPVLPTTPIDYNAATGDTVTVTALDSYLIPGGYDLFRPYAFVGFDESQVVTVVNGKAVDEHYEQDFATPGFTRRATATATRGAHGVRAMHRLRHHR